MSEERTGAVEQRVVRHPRHARHQIVERPNALDAVHIESGGIPLQVVDTLAYILPASIDVDESRAQLEPVEPVHRIEASVCGLTNDDAVQRQSLHDLARLQSGRVVAAATVVENRLLREREVVVQPVAEVRVRGEHLCFFKPAVDAAGEDELPVADEVAEHDGRSAVHALAIVVLRVPDRRALDVLCAQGRVIRFVLERTLRWQRERGAVHQGCDRHRRSGSGRARRRQLGGVSHAGGSAVERLSPAVGAVLRQALLSERGDRCRGLRRLHGLRRARPRRVDSGGSHGRRGRPIRLLPELTRIADGPHGVLAVVEVDEREFVRLPGPGHGRAVFRHGLYTADEFRELVVILRFEIVEKHLGNAGAIADEGQRFAVRRPHGVEVLPALSGDDRDFLRLQVKQVDLPLAELEEFEVGALATVADESNRASVR